ncbi:hypothetical protein MiSe_08650 [Microseira wollei NIES-4236]|uniref:Uncharacterized protein n=2 Tax=Microseira wollei TaxID=467598 RepID=A0AAV3X9X1_9CYAN|nr:hypothetical protein MiSe_08650 [Microseira wollei NIES-4236]
MAMNCTGNGCPSLDELLGRTYAKKPGFYQKSLAEGASAPSQKPGFSVLLGIESARANTPRQIDFSLHNVNNCNKTPKNIWQG